MTSLKAETHSGREEQLHKGEAVLSAKDQLIEACSRAVAMVDQSDHQTFKEISSQVNRVHS
jgi:hypothetical protein